MEAVHNAQPSPADQAASLKLLSLMIASAGTARRRERRPDQTIMQTHGHPDSQLSTSSTSSNHHRELGRSLLADISIT
jgi:hypothetical protein